MNIFTPDPVERRTTATDVFERLHSDIVSFRLVPGTKLSEVDVARQNEVSRQPVREAFIRLSNLGLLRIQPQKATTVRKISLQDIENTRFIRTAVEVEVVRKACALGDKSRHDGFVRNLNRQRRAVERKDTDGFHRLDYEFHHLMCLAADREFAFDVIADAKARVDRVCILSLAGDQGMAQLRDDHERMVAALIERNEEDLVALTRLHLSRLDEAIADARKNHPDYFED